MDLQAFLVTSSVGSDKQGRENIYYMEYLYQNKHNVGRNINVKGVSGDGCVLHLYGKQNLQVMDIQLRRIPNKMLNDISLLITVKCKRNDKLRKELLGEKGLAFDNFWRFLIYLCGRGC